MRKRPNLGPTPLGCSIETYTDARWMDPPPGMEKPRPLRSLDRPWGMEQRCPAEVQQFRVGSALFFSAALFCTWAMVAGGCATALRRDLVNKRSDVAFPSVARKEHQEVAGFRNLYARNLINGRPPLKLLCRQLFFGLAQTSLDAAAGCSTFSISPGVISCSHPDGKHSKLLFPLSDSVLWKYGSWRVLSRLDNCVVLQDLV